MKSKIRNLPAYILAASLSYPTLAAWLPDSQQYMVESDKVVYQAQLQRDSLYPRRKTWNITSGGINNPNARNIEVIGDEQHEEKLFRELAFTATIASFAKEPTLKQELSNESHNLDTLIGKYYNMTKFGEYTLSGASYLGGMILPLLATKSPNMPVKSQSNQIQTLAKKAAQNFISEVTQNVYFKDEADNAREYKKRADKKAIVEILQASQRIDSAKEILDKHNGFWKYQEANEFYTNWRSGLVYGLAYANVLQDVNKVDANKIGKLIGINALKGIGIPMDIISISKNARDYLTPVEVDQIASNLNRYILEAEKTFQPIEELYNVEPPLRELSQHPSSIIQSANQNTSRSELAPIKWISQDATRGLDVIRGEKDRCFNIIVTPNQSIKKYKSLEVIIDDIKDPLGNRRSIQRLSMEARPGNSAFPWEDQHIAGKLYAIPNAVCIDTTSSTIPGNYTIEYLFNYTYIDGNKSKSRVFVNHVNVK